MRPIKLTMTAFGPYRDAETIDFMQLEDKRIFVISGSTGAGKTTIFDAICYALYDSASGEDRAETRMLRSHYATDDVHTSVELTFAIGKRSYRVFRQMGHRKGSNKSETGEKAELYELTTGEEVPVAERFLKKEVNDKLEAILGLTREQFSQIVMLPQGEFRKLLTSDTDNKEEILRHIFRTQLYERLESKFQQDSKELRERHRDAKARLELQMLQVRETLPLRESSQLRLTFEQDVYSPGQIVDGLRQEAEHYLTLSRSVDERRSEIAAAVNRQEQLLREALALNESFALLESKRSMRAELELQRASIDRREAQLELAERAARIEPYAELADQAARDLEQKRQQTEAKSRVIETVRQELVRAEDNHRAEAAREPERKALELELQRLTEMEPVVQTLDAQRSELNQLLAQEQEHQKKLAELNQRIQANRDSKLAMSAELRELEAKVARLPDKLRALEQLRQQHKVLKEMLLHEQQLRQLAELAVQRDQALAALRAEHDRLEQQWLDGQAGLLAAHLHDGQPCPVCGSSEHPNKAQAGEALPSREALKEAKDRLSLLEQELSAVKGQSAAAQASWDNSRLAAAESGLAAQDDAQEQLARIGQQGKSLRAETEQLEQSQAALARLRAAIDKLEAEYEAWQRQREQLSESAQRNAVALGSRRSALDSELARIPEQLRTPEQLMQHTERQRQLLARLSAAWEAAAQQLQHGMTRAAEERAALEQLNAQYAESGEKLAAAKARLSSELAKAEFASIGQYKESMLPEAQRQKYKQEIEAFRRQLAANAQQIEELERSLEGQSPADVQAQTQALEAAKLEAERIQTEWLAAQRYREEAERLRGAIAAAYDAIKQIEHDLEQVLDLYQMIKGDNALKISFERYILIEFLEQILHAANVRLQQLSSGQFALRRSDRLETRGKQSGLGLDVYDAYTGQNRDVKSLSGGEKFNASLSLALGMTDVIQAHQGGVTIEMMFIDEGFGSLDEESLNKAISTLVDLQRAGRMIGVISHVRELKQAFPAVLEVRKTKEGFSRTEIAIH